MSSENTGKSKGIRHSLLNQTNNFDPKQLEAQVKAYWTDERKKSAQPLPFPKLVPSQSGTIAPSTNTDNSSKSDTLPSEEDIRQSTNTLPFISTQVSDTQLISAPYQSVGKLFFTVANGKNYRASAFLVSPSLVMTAGHCVYDPGTGYSQNLQLELQYSNGSSAEIIIGGQIFVLPQWYQTQPNSLTILSTEIQFDIAFFEATSPSNLPVLSPQFAGPNNQTQWGTLGYPHNYNTGEYMMQCIGNSLNSTSGSKYPGTNILASDFVHGASGSPVLLLDSNSNLTTSACGVLSSGEPVTNEVICPQLWDSAKDLYSFALNSVMVWQKELQDGASPTSVVYLTPYLYAASNGIISKISLDGSSVQVNGLSGLGHEEIRLCVGNSQVFLGTNGWVAAIEPTNFTGAPVWKTELLNASGVVSLIYETANNTIFAGSNGYVYAINPDNGSVSATNNLTGFGEHELRLATDGNYLYVGTNSKLIRIPLDNFTISNPPCISLSTSSGNVVNLCYDGNANMYAGCDGYVYQIDINDFTGLPNELSGLGHEEVRLAIYTNPSNNQIYVVVGTNGQVVVLSANDFTGQFIQQTTLPKVGDNVTSVIVTSDMIYAGGNGYFYILYILNPFADKIVYTNGLSGLGHQEVRLATDGANYVFLGTNGYAVCFNMY